MMGKKKQAMKRGGMAKKKAVKKRGGGMLKKRGGGMAEKMMGGGMVSPRKKMAMGMMGGGMMAKKKMAKGGRVKPATGRDAAAKKASGRNPRIAKMIGKFKEGKGNPAGKDMSMKGKLLGVMKKFRKPKGTKGALRPGLKK